MKNETLKVVSKSHRGGSDLLAGLEDIRLKIISASMEIFDIERAPVSLDIAKGRFDAWLSGLAKEDAVTALLQRFTAPAYRDPAPADGVEILIGIMAQSAKGDLAALLDAFAGDRVGFSDADRADRLRAASAHLFELEIAEETIIRQAEKLGIEVLRRADANPLAVLAREEDLP